MEKTNEGVVIGKIGGILKIEEFPYEKGGESRVFKKRQFFVIVDNGEYKEDHVKLEFHGKLIDKLDGLKKDDYVKVVFAVKGQKTTEGKYKGKIFNNNVAWFLAKHEDVKQPDPPDGAEGENDLPF